MIKAEIVFIRDITLVTVYEFSAPGACFVQQKIYTRSRLKEMSRVVFM